MWQNKKVTWQTEGDDPPGLHKIIENLLSQVSDTEQAVKFLQNICYVYLNINCFGLWPNLLYRLLSLLFDKWVVYISSNSNTSIIYLYIVFCLESSHQILKCYGGIKVWMKSWQVNDVTNCNSNSTSVREWIIGIKCIKDQLITYSDIKYPMEILTLS